jgi:hypothetical protein
MGYEKKLQAGLEKGRFIAGIVEGLKPCSAVTSRCHWCAGKKAGGVAVV